MLRSFIISTARSGSVTSAITRANSSPPEASHGGPTGDGALQPLGDLAEEPVTDGVAQACR